jgi:hypothetical protein
VPWRLLGYDLDQADPADVPARSISATIRSFSFRLQRRRRSGAATILTQGDFAQISALLVFLLLSNEQITEADNGGHAISQRVHRQGGDVISVLVGSMFHC